MEIRSLSEADARAIATWRYPGRYATYDMGETVISDDRFRTVARGDELVGYCCFGPEARVPGVDAEEGTLDVGYGLRPDLIGCGLGRTFVGTILRFAAGESSARELRLLILSWNERSLRVAEALGFEHERTVSNTDGDFLVMKRPTRDLI